MKTLFLSLMTFFRGGPMKKMILLATMTLLMTTNFAFAKSLEAFVTTGIDRDSDQETYILIAPNGSSSDAINCGYGFSTIRVDENQIGHRVNYPFANKTNCIKAMKKAMSA